MKMPSWLYDQGPCSEAQAWIGSLPNDLSIDQAWTSCRRPGWMLWLISEASPRWDVVLAAVRLLLVMQDDVEERHRAAFLQVVKDLEARAISARDRWSGRAEDRNYRFIFFEHFDKSLFSTIQNGVQPECARDVFTRSEHAIFGAQLVFELASEIGLSRQDVYGKLHLIEKTARVFLQDEDISKPAGPRLCCAIRISLPRCPVPYEYDDDVDPDND
jgi:hypothetical protein